MSLHEAKVLIERWRRHHNEVRPHSSLGYLPPAEARVVAGLPRQLEDLLAHPERNRRVIERLFPASYSDPAEQAAGIGGNLVELYCGNGNFTIALAGDTMLTRKLMPFNERISPSSRMAANCTAGSVLRSMPNATACRCRRRSSGCRG